MPYWPGASHRCASTASRQASKRLCPRGHRRGCRRPDRRIAQPLDAGRVIADMQGKRRRQPGPLPPTKWHSQQSSGGRAVGYPLAIRQPGRLPPALTVALDGSSNAESGEPRSSTCHDIGPEVRCRIETGAAGGDRPDALAPIWSRRIDGPVAVGWTIVWRLRATRRSACPVGGVFGSGAVLRGWPARSISVCAAGEHSQPCRGIAGPDDEAAAQCRPAMAWRSTPSPRHVHSYRDLAVVRELDHRYLAVGRVPLVIQARPSAAGRGHRANAGCRSAAAMIAATGNRLGVWWRHLASRRANRRQGRHRAPATSEVRPRGRRPVAAASAWLARLPQAASSTSRHRRSLAKTKPRCSSSRMAAGQVEAPTRHQSARRRRPGMPAAGVDLAAARHGHRAGTWRQSAATVCRGGRGRGSVADHAIGASQAARAQCWRGLPPGRCRAAVAAGGRHGRAARRAAW